MICQPCYTHCFTLTLAITNWYANILIPTQQSGSMKEWNKLPILFEIESTEDETYLLILISLTFLLHHPMIFQIGTCAERIYSKMLHPVLLSTCQESQSSLFVCTNRWELEKQSPTFCFCKEATQPLSWCVSRAVSLICLWWLKYCLQAPNFCSIMREKAKGGYDLLKEDEQMYINIEVWLI